MLSIGSWDFASQMHSSLSVFPAFKLSLHTACNSRRYLDCQQGLSTNSVRRRCLVQAGQPDPVLRFGFLFSFPSLDRRHLYHGLSARHSYVGSSPRLAVHRAVAQTTSPEVPRLNKELDDELSNRHIDLDPAGYFLIKVDRDAREVIVEHYTNTINKNGVACDPETGKPIPCTPGKRREPSATFRGATAKELSVKLLEQQERPLVTMLVHANYLGREFQRAEAALISGDDYIQD